MTELAQKILYNIYHRETQEALQNVIEILENDDIELPSTKANEICEVLGIQKRHNRQVITDTIIKYNNANE